MSTSALLLAAALLPGIYEPFEGNEPSICPQEVRAYEWDGELTGLQVTYVGDCFSMGPYVYGCNGWSCGDSGISFQIVARDEYVWRNEQYGFQARFKLRAK